MGKENRQMWNSDGTAKSSASLNSSASANSSAGQSQQFTSKADPSTAMNEAQPSDVAFTDNTLGSLSGTRHKDMDGNIIAEPDLSNPTRYRFERPLDTIRSFERAIQRRYRDG